MTDSRSPRALSRRGVLVRGTAGLCLFGTGALISSSTRAQRESVDLLLLLAIDSSFSVSRTEYNLQIQGLALGFLDPEIIAAATSGPTGRIAVSVMQWSSEFSQIQAIPWTVVDGAQSAVLLSGALSTMPRQTADGATALGDALSAAGAYIESAPYEAFRRVIDVSGDGRKNTGSVVSPVRDALIARGITINGLAILNEDPRLDLYYSESVVGGIGSFTLVANDYNQYGEAIRRKLLREIRFVPVSDNSDPSELTVIQ